MDLPSYHKKLFNDFITFKIKHITWDFDQILVDSETPIKERFFNITGLDYRNKKLDQWLSLANWASGENKMDFNEAADIENKIWDDPNILIKAKPISIIQKYSRNASCNSVKQSVVTSRHPKLLKITMDSIRKNYPWIGIDDIHIRQDNTMHGDEYKGKKVGQIASNVHIDDSVMSATSVLENSNAFVILFPRFLEKNKFKGNKRVLELANIDVLNEYIK